MSFPRWLYQASLGLALVLAAPFLLARKGRHYLTSLPGRLGRGRPGGEAGALWIHAVSVGEVGVAATLARALPASLPLLVTTVTPTGQEQAKKVFAGRATIAYLPFDLDGLVRRFLDRFDPRALILIEGEYWPLLLSHLKRRGRPVMVVNGRMSDRGFARLRRAERGLRPLLAALFAPVAHFGVQTVADRDRLLALGVPAEKVTVTGNLKFEAPEPAAKPELDAALRSLAGKRPILLAGSTMAGEEEAVLEAFRTAGGGERALLVLAPRHPERFAEVERLLARRELPFLRRTQLARDETPAAGAPAVLLLDSLGELAGLYRLALAAFIGGTLVPKGGHNPLEPARFGIAVAVGPAMENFRDMAERFDAAGAWRRVSDAAGLGAAWGEWLAEPGAARALGERATALVAENRGALDRTLAMLAPLLASAGASPEEIRSPGAQPP